MKKKARKGSKKPARESRVWFHGEICIRCHQFLVTDGLTIWCIQDRCPDSKGIEVWP